MATNEQILQAIRQRRANYRPGKFRKKLKKPKRWLWPASVAREYTRALWGLVEEMNQAIEADILPHLPELAELAASVRPDSLRADDVVDWAEKVAELTVKARTGFEKKRKADAEGLARIYAEQASEWNDKEFKAVVKSAIGVDPFVREPWLKAELNGFVRQNVALIKSLPDQHFKDIEGITLRGLQAGRRHEEIAKEIREKFQAPRNRAELIARDQISKLDGQLTRLRQQGLGISRYTWRTSRDERVRSRHREREGKVFSWDDPPPGGHPQQEIQCRCKAEPILDDLLDGVDNEGTAETEKPEEQEAAKAVITKKSNEAQKAKIDPEAQPPEANIAVSKSAEFTSGYEIEVLPDGRVEITVGKYSSASNDDVIKYARKELREIIDDGLKRKKFFDDTYWRFTDNVREIEYARRGELRPSFNHIYDTPEKGLSVSREKFFRYVWDYDYGYKVTGKKITTGSDDEPILDVKSIKVVSKKLRKSSGIRDNELKQYWDEVGDILSKRGWSLGQYRALVKSPNVIR